MSLISQLTHRGSRGSTCHFARFAPVCLALLLLSSATSLRAQQTSLTKRPPAKFLVSFGSELSATPLDGRVFVAISTVANGEPRFQISEQEARSQQLFGVDVDGLKPGDSAAIDDDTLGYPLRSLKEIPAGDYYVQAVFNKYTTFHLANGHTVKLPMDEGEGQHWNCKPGNFFSKPEKIHFDPSVATTVKIRLTETISPIQPPPDTDWVKHVRIQSQALTKFYGRPMYLGAIVVLPEGWTTHPNAHYPLARQSGPLCSRLRRLPHYAAHIGHDTASPSSARKLNTSSIRIGPQANSRACCC